MKLHLRELLLTTEPSYESLDVVSNDVQLVDEDNRVRSTRALFLKATEFAACAEPLDVLAPTRNMLDLFSTTQKQQQLKLKLKLWEKEFRKQNNREPAKQDIQTISEIRSLYREYARLKLKLQKNRTINGESVKRSADAVRTENGHDSLLEHRGGEVSKSSLLALPESTFKPYPVSRLCPGWNGRSEGSVFLPLKSVFTPACSSSEKSEDGSYISATPPKRKVSEADPSLTPVSSYRPLRRPLEELTAGNLNSPVKVPPPPRSPQGFPKLVPKIDIPVILSKRKTPEVVADERLASTPTSVPIKENTPTLPAMPLEPGFVIKRRRPGVVLDEQTRFHYCDALPAGFSANVWESSLIRDYREPSEEMKESPFQCEELLQSYAEEADLTTSESRLCKQMYTDPQGTATDNSPLSPQKLVSAVSFPSLECSSISRAELVSKELHKSYVNGENHSSVDAVREPSSRTSFSLRTSHLSILKEKVGDTGLPVSGGTETSISRPSSELGAETAAYCPTVLSENFSHCKVLRDRPKASGPTGKRTLKSAATNACALTPDCIAASSLCDRLREYLITSARLTRSKDESSVREIIPMLSQDIVVSDMQDIEVEVVGSSLNSRRLKKRTSLELEEAQEEELSGSRPTVFSERKQRQPKTIPSAKYGSVVLDRHRHQSKGSERNNFIKINFRKGGGRRKFVNKSHSRKWRPQYRRGHYKKSERDAEYSCIDDVAGDVESRCLMGAGRKLNMLDFQKSINLLSPVLSDSIERVLIEPSETNLLDVLKEAFGFQSFRPGQYAAVKRILSSLSTMLKLPTGAGKSVCYQLPALVLPGLTLVISPLTALMSDQLRHLPPSLPGAILSSTQTIHESSAVVARLQAGLIKVLFTSPERLCTENFQRALTEAPKINFAVIDEAHCLSEWSHNFRPSYLRLGRVLSEHLHVRCILAMTATATKRAERSIMNVLRIPADGLVEDSCLRDNILLRVSRESNKRRALLNVLQSSSLSETRSVVIYCTFQAEADNVCEFLLQSGIQAESYHANKTGQERSRILELFCSNKLRVVVATVAFGMGLDKSDVRTVIHYNMPRSLEHYVQETGRAGRDRERAFCHLFVDDNDYKKLRSLAHSDGVDEGAIGKFLTQIFRPNQELSQMTYIFIDEATLEFDMKEEVLETILSQLEVEDEQYLRSVSRHNVTCSLSFHRSSPRSLAEVNFLVSKILERSQKQGGNFVFNIISLAADLRVSMGGIQQELRRLQDAGEISCDYSDPAFSFTLLRIPEDVFNLTSVIAKRLDDLVTNTIWKVDKMYEAAMSAIDQKRKEYPKESLSASVCQQKSLQQVIRQYFEEENDSCIPHQIPSVIRSHRRVLGADVKDFVRCNKHSRLTGRAVARIFYGIGSPAFPSSEWSKNHLWGKYEGVEFSVLKEVATSELLSQQST